MSTGDKYLHLTSKRILGVDDLGYRFLEYMRLRVEEVNKQQYESSFFHPNGIVMSADGNDKFKLEQDTPGGNAIGSDGLGNFLDFQNSIYEGIQFENSNTIDYSVGIKHCVLPSGIQINPITASPEWISFEDQIGEEGNPNSVTDNGNGTITFRVDSVTETGVSNAGRIVSVYKIIPGQAATTEALAKEEIAIVWTSGENRITTVGNFGQSTVSTVATDYKVVVKGPTVKRYTDLSLEAGYTFIGVVTGAGLGNPPTTFDISDQKIISYSWTELLLNGVNQDFFPAIDNTYDLGTISRRWATVHAVDFSISGDLLPSADGTQDVGSMALSWADGWFDGSVSVGALTVANNPAGGQGIGGSLVPIIDDAYDLGSSSYQFDDGWFDGRVTVDELSVSTTAGEGVVSSLVPSTNGTLDLGSSSYRWDDCFVEKLNVTEQILPVFGCEVGGSLIPFPTGSFDLGSNTLKWREIWVNEVNAIDDVFSYNATIEGTLRTNGLLTLSTTPGEGVNTAIYPSADNSYDIGFSSYQWRNIYINGTAYIDNLNLSNTAGEGVDTDFVPRIDGSKLLGNSSYRWDHVYTDQIWVRSGAGGGVSNNLQPTINDTYNLGDPSYNWNTLLADTVDINNLTLSDSAGQGITGNFVPDTDGLYNLGSASYRFNDLYTDGTTVEMSGIPAGATAAGAGAGTGELWVTSGHATLPNGVVMRG